MCTQLGHSLKNVCLCTLPMHKTSYTLFLACKNVRYQVNLPANQLTQIYIIVQIAQILGQLTHVFGQPVQLFWTTHPVILYNSPKLLENIFSHNMIK